MSTPSARFLSLLALAGFAGAADPLVEIAVGPSARFIERFNATGYGKVWADPALKPLHDAIDDVRGKAVEENGIDIPAVLLEQRGAGLRMLALTADGAPFAWLADLGDHAPEVAAAGKKAWPAPTEAKGADEAWTSGDVRMARFGNVIRGAGAGTEGFPEWKPDPGDDDILMRADLRALCEQGEKIKPDPDLDPAIPALVAKLGELRFAMRIGAEDLETRYRAHIPTAGLLPIAKARLDRVPANALEVNAVGFDGAAWWKEFGPAILGIAVAGSRDRHGADHYASSAEAQAAADQALATIGLPSLPELLAAFKGTAVLITTPGTPFPGYTLSLERTPQLDAVAKALLTAAGVEAPAEGGTAALQLPRFPIMPQVLLTKDEWVLTTDPGLAAAWPGTGWADSVAGKSALAHLDAHTCLLTASDTAAQLRMLSGMAGMFLGSIPGATPAQKQAILVGMTKLAAVAKPAWTATRVAADGVEGEGRGFGSTSTVMPIAIIAAIAIPNLLESRTAAQESAAAAALKSGILPAEVQFQNGGYIDQDGNGIGEYGFLSEMSGLVKPGGIELNLLAPAYQHPEKPISGYYFAVFLPNGDNTGAITDPYPDVRPEGPVGNRERMWVAYAWPADAKQGHRMFGINQAGNVYFETYQGKAPEWNALMGGKGWSDQPTWKPYRRSR